MALSAQVNKVSIKHDAILDFLVANPTLKRSEVAGYFGVTVPWLSTIIHSDVFQELLKERQDLIFDIAVVRPIQEKLMGAANMATERLMEMIPFETDIRTLTNVVDKTLDKLGYGQKVIGSQVNQQTNISLVVSKDDLASARELIGRVKNVSESYLQMSASPPSETPVLYIPAPEHRGEE